MADVLEEILTARRKTLDKAKERVTLSELDQRVAKAARPIGFGRSINQKGQLSVIAEMKRKSPSAGELQSDYNVAKIAAAYHKGGARALSVLTDSDYFGGDILDIQRAKDASGLPVLRKDFIFDPYQIAEARAHGADAVLLIADMLDPHHLKDLVECAREYELDPLVEIFTASVLEAALKSGANLIGINNRNLRTLEMVPGNVAQISRLVPSDRTVVAESGIKTPEDMRKIKALGIRAALVGESFLKQTDLEKAVRHLVEAI